MFNKKINKIWERFEEWHNEVYLKDDLVECEKCGCLLRKKTAQCIKKLETKEQKLEIYLKLMIKEYPDRVFMSQPDFKDEITKTYYCKVHKKAKIK